MHELFDFLRELVSGVPLAAAPVATKRARMCLAGGAPSEGALDEAKRAAADPAASGPAAKRPNTTTTA